MPLPGAVMTAAALLALAPASPDEVAGWKAVAGAVRYDATTIFEYIDGHGEVYLAYGMIACQARRYAGPAGEADLVLDVFEMDSAADAFGVFTHSREGERVEIGQDASFGYGTLAFWKGHFFVSASAEQDDERARQALLALGRAVADGIPETGAPPALVGRLPQAGLQPATLVYLRHPRILEAHLPIGSGNPLGIGPRSPAVLGHYLVAGGAGDLVVVEYADSATADAALARFNRDFLAGAASSRRDDGWCAAGAVDARTRAYVLRAATGDTALALLAQVSKGGAP